MRKTSKLPDDFKARMKIIQESTPTRVRLPEIKNVTAALENIERANNKETKQVLNALNRTAGEIVKLRTADQANSEKLKGAFSTEVAELNGAFTDVVMALTELPSLIPTTDVQPVTEAIQALEQTVQGKETEVNVAAPEVNVEIDDLKKDLKAVEKAIKAIVIPEVKIPEQKETDVSGLEGLLRRLLTGIEEVRDRPLPTGYATVTAQMQGWDSTNGQWVAVAVDSDGTLQTNGTGTPADTTDNILLESGDAVLLESGDLVLTDA